jgi:23S rRNA (guanosine2251-2'-O)-methyltransferase
MRQRRAAAKGSPEHTSRSVWGMNPVVELLRARPEEVETLWLAEPKAELLALAKDAGIPFQKVARERLNLLSGGGVHQGVVAQLREYRYAELEELIERGTDKGTPPLLVVLDGIQDPQNLGAIIRSTHALGGHGVIIPQDRAAGMTGTVMKAAAGAAARCPVARVVNLSRTLERLKEAGFWVAAADIRGAQAPARTQLSGPLALVIGAEGSGIREGVLKHCDFRLKIPMQGELASLNASVSAGILLYEIARQRLAAVGRG